MTVEPESPSEPEAISWKNGDSISLQAALRPDPNYQLGWKDFEERKHHLIMRQLPQVRSLHRAPGKNELLSSSKKELLLLAQKVQGNLGVQDFEIAHQMALWHTSVSSG